LAATFECQAQLLAIMPGVITFQLLPERSVDFGLPVAALLLWKFHSAPTAAAAAAIT